MKYQNLVNLRARKNKHVLKIRNSLLSAFNIAPATFIINFKIKKIKKIKFSIH